MSCYVTKLTAIFLYRPRFVENKRCHGFLRIYIQGVTCQATDVALPLRLEDACNPLFVGRGGKEREKKKRKGNFRFKGAARDELFRKCRCYGGILRLTSSLFLFREERIQAKNLRFIGLKITIPTRALFFPSSSPSVSLELLSRHFFSSFPFLVNQSSCRAFSPLFFSSPFDHYATPTQLPAFLPFPVINPSSRDPESGSKRFRRPDLKRQSLDTSVLRYLVYLPYIPIRSNCK